MFGKYRFANQKDPLEDRLYGIAYILIHTQTIF